MRVRRLQVQGFKTFASKVTFEFPAGITAIVGPNGSGKSNLADALRWVLGEQSYSTLRSRRSRDLIFSGSSSRPRMGMAQVSLLLDNEDRFLPIDFAEVEIARRAHRSGVNEYLLNRRRVRLQDILELLGGVTSSYVVIHQGLVDEALSLRPKERRTLLEEAAEVRRYHERRQKAQERLDRTATNMTRISDLRSELAPRLRVLERQSRQARQRAELEQALQQALRSWYGLLWEEASTRLTEVVQEGRQAQARLEQATAALEAVQDRVAGLRQTIQEARRRQEERRREEAELRRREEALRESLAQVEGERGALRRYQTSLQTEWARWRQEMAAQEARLAELEQTRSTFQQRVEQAQAELASREAVLVEQEEAREVLRSAREELQQRTMTTTMRALELERREERLGDRLASLEREIADRTSSLDGLSRRWEQAEGERARAEGELRQLRKDLADLQEGEEEQRRRVHQLSEDVEQAGTAVEASRLRLAENRARLEALSQQGAALGDGSLYVQQWARQEGRPALEGLLARLSIPPCLTAAVQAALGPYLTALLASDWEEAQAALEALLADGAGRATLLPRAELRPPDLASGGGPGPAPRPGEGLLLDHLSFAEEDAAPLRVLLGRVLLAADLASARRIALDLRPGWVVVTRQGHALTAEGVVSGGRPADGSSSLAQVRERRALGRSVVERERACREQERAWDALQRERAEAEAALVRLGRQREERRLLCEERARQVQGLDRDLAQLEEERSRHQGALEELRQERARLGEERASLQEELRRCRSDREALQEELARRRQAEQQVEQASAQAREELQQARTVWAVIQSEQENLQALGEVYRRNLDRLREQTQEGQQRLQEMEAQLVDQGRQAVELRARLEEATEAVNALSEEVWTVPVSLDRLTQLDEEVARRRQAVRMWEGAAGRAAVEVERQRDRLKELLRRGLSEVGPEASAYGQAGEALLNALLEDPPAWARGPVDADLSAEELERRIALLREEIRRVGPVNPLAEQEYRQSRERYDFLDGQLQDLHDTVRSLRQVIAELDRAMEQRFEETFAAINQAFQAYFARLFGGGVARLQIVRAEEEAEGLEGLGVEIVARPPGKRAHTLALLSGGERALTSTALLFAILKVNPRPFCLLDEVDAMLDEANVGRFRECLEELAGETQFIVITHNRVTIEAASTLYGISLDDDGTSRVLSLRMEEALQVARGVA